nr:putative ribonuclease H-like domain-containing protein [Tanacetum cinerariifolium]
GRYSRSPRNQDNRPRNQDSSRKTLNMEDPSSKAMVATDGVGFDWSYMADEEVLTNMALMAFSNSEIQNSKTCSNTCLKSFETFKTQYDNLRIEFNKSEFNLTTYKRGLASVEEQLVFYKKNEEVKKTDNSRTGLGFTSYNDVAPPPTGLFAPPSINLSNSGLEEFQQPEFKGYGPKDIWVSDSDEDESEEMVLKSDNVQHKPEQANQPRKMVQKPMLKNVEKRMVQMEVRPVWNNAMRTNHQNFSNSRRNFAPTAVLTKFGIVPISTARQSSSRAAAPVIAARPINTAAFKPLVNVAKPRQNALQTSHSLSRRPFYQQAALKNRNFNNNVNTAKANSVNTAKGNNIQSITSVVGNQGTNVVQSLACWVWRPKIKVQDHVSKNSRSYICKQFDYVDPEGRLKSMMEGMLALGGAKGGKITGKGTIRTGKLDFEDVYFVKELQFNLLSVLQMCDKKNSVLFTDTECFVLSPDFKLANESQVLLKVSRKNNMYSFDMKNIVPQKDLTCLLAKATNDESMLWHRRLGHNNFKNINKLVKDNLVRGLPSKRFENNQTCVACLKGKQHKVSFKSKLPNSISQSLFMLHMDLFGPTSMSSIMHKKYCLVITDDFSRFTWVFF